MTDEWSLLSLTRQILDESPLSDPHLLARKVALAIPDDRLRDAVDQMIGAYVVGIVTRSRWSGPDLTTSDQSLSDTHSVAVAGGDPSASPDQRLGDTQGCPVGAGTHSRWAGAAAAYKRMLDQRIATGDGWKFLRDFTADDLAAASGLRRLQAARSIARAETLDRLADALDANGCTTVGDLPDDVLREVLG